MKLSQCVAITNGELVNGDREFSTLSTDTRSISAGDLFVALRGKNYDAHDFLPAAVAAGAGALVVERAEESSNVPQLVVKDTTAALGSIAALKRSFFQGELIAITGSSGKTTVKGMLAAILAERGFVKATRGNYNNQIGVPLTLMRLEPDDQYAVIEMGANGLGEIHYLAAMAQPQTALVNNVMPAHLEGFGSLEGVAREKGQIYSPLPPDGTAIINLDDDFCPYFIEQTEACGRLGFCLGEPRPDLSKLMPTVYAREVTEDSVGRPAFVLVYGRETMPIQLSVLGKHNVANALAAAACALAAGAALTDVRAGLATFAGEARRMQVHRAINGATLIDDSYNANPGSMRAAIDYLGARIQPKILIMGDLAELGEDAVREHRELGVYAREKGVDTLLTCGRLTRETAQAFGGAARHFETRDELIAYLESGFPSTAIVLIKGSRSAGMEHVVTALRDAGTNNLNQTGEQQ